jgi:hypothetical protein
VKAVEQKSGSKYTIKIINFDDYEDYKFKEALYEVYIMQQMQNNQSNVIQIRDAYILENEDKDVQKSITIIDALFHTDRTDGEL